MTYKINQEIKEQIIIMDSNGDVVTGLTDIDFSTSLLYEGAVATETLSITEKGDGYYYISFTPENDGYYEWIVSHTTYNPSGWYDYYTIINYNEDDLYTQINTKATEIIDNDDSNIGTLNTTINDNQNVLLGSFSSQEELLVRVLGLNHENIYIDNLEYNSSSLLTNSRLRLYSNPASIGTGSDVIATYNMTSEYVGTFLESYKLEKE
jgi:hypothetical protein